MLACSASPQTDVIKEGDLVIVYESYASMKSAVVTRKGQFSNRYGNFNHEHWIGRQYGSKVFCKPPGKGWVYLIAPTPELWSLVLRHRTQILYVADISLVCSYLELRPGSVVLESGTGSGSLTHSLARTVAPTGHVHTFEFHELRCQEAGREFREHGLEPYVTCRLRNIEEDGFPDELHGKADGLFLDLPGPWKVVPSAAACLKPDGRFCSFSPCIEQVQRTCLALAEHGFVDVVTYECLLRVHEVYSEVIVSELGSSGAAAKRQKVQGGRKQQGQGQGQGQGQAAGQAAGEAAAADGAAAGEGAAVGGGQQGQGVQGQGQEQQRHIVTKPAMDAKGHTGYLTFGRKFVR